MLQGLEHMPGFQKKHLDCKTNMTNLVKGDNANHCITMRETRELSS